MEIKTTLNRCDTKTTPVLYECNQLLIPEDNNNYFPIMIFWLIAFSIVSLIIERIA